MDFDFSALNLSPAALLAVTAMVLMLTLTLGVIYLTAAEWRDRRRQKQDQR